jgi:hypothetical protein
MDGPITHMRRLNNPYFSLALAGVFIANRVYVVIMETECQIVPDG